MAVLAVGMAAGVCAVGFEGLACCAPEIFGTLHQVAGGDFARGVVEELPGQVRVLVYYGLGSGHRGPSRRGVGISRVNDGGVGLHLW